MNREQFGTVAQLAVGRTVVRLSHWPGGRAMIHSASFEPSTAVTIELQLHAVDQDVTRARVWSLGGDKYMGEALVEVQPHQTPVFDVYAREPGRLSLCLECEFDGLEPVVQLAHETLSMPGTT